MIKNIPKYARNFNYIVVREFDHELWFWGAWNSYEDAYATAMAIDGEIVTNK